MTNIIIALVLFLITYILLFALPNKRSYVALGSAIIFSFWLGLFCKDINWNIKDIIGAIDFNVLMMITGTMGIVTLFIESKMPMKLADIILAKFKNVQLIIVAMAVLSGVVSAFVDNVATVLMIAPIALAVCKKQKISPVAPIIAIAVSSNLQGAATLVGDTTSILLADKDFANMNFLDFFFMDGKVSIFFAVEIGALLTAILLLFMFRKEKKPLEKIEGEETVVTDYLPTYLMAGVIILLIVASLIPFKYEVGKFSEVLFDHKNGLICMSLLIIGIIIESIKNKESNSLKVVLKDLDYQTLLLLASLFIVIGSIDRAGVINWIAKLISNTGGNNIFVLYTIIVFASVAVSAFVDNIPYVTVMLPVIKSLSEILGFDPVVLYFGLLIGATLGGNITPVGASANITGIGILRKEGYEVKTKEFMKISVPFTAIAVLSGYAIIWLFWGI